jgi:hypothetical protein
MFSGGGFDINGSRRRLLATEEAIDALVALAKDDPDKALVMTYIGQLVADGYAVWDMIGNGEIEVRFTSGQTDLPPRRDHDPAARLIGELKEGRAFVGWLSELRMATVFTS